MRETTEVAIIGGGVIGLAAALRLAAERREVVVIEPNEPGSGASYGNAGTIADYAVIPVGTPAVLRNLPSLLFDRDSPLAIRRAALPALMPWLLRFAWQSLPAQTAANAATLARLLAGASDAWRELAANIGAADLIRQDGCLYLYASKSALNAAASDSALRKRHDIKQVFVTADEVTALEPNLPPFEGGGVLFPDAMHLTDPGEMMRRLASAAANAGVRFVRAKAEVLTRTGARVFVRTGSAEVRARTVVVAAGAHSKALAAQAGDNVPLDTERGYHIEFDMQAPPVSRPVCPTSKGFYLVPMASRLRVAGTVELGGLTAPPNPCRIALLESGVREMLPSIGFPARSWMGFRPSMPDSVPVIRPSRGGNDVILAFGHGHLGLTLAPMTARIVADLVSRRAVTR